jgi:hypothetical protein
MDIKVVTDIIDKLAVFKFDEISIINECVVVSKRTNDINVMVRIHPDNRWVLWSTNGCAFTGADRNEVVADEVGVIKQLHLLLDEVNEIEQLKLRVFQLEQLVKLDKLIEVEENAKWVKGLHETLAKHNRDTERRLSEDRLNHLRNLMNESDEVKTYLIEKRNKINIALGK